MNNLETIPVVDALAVGAHPDDVEVGIGGLVSKAARRGYRVGILDLTRGEMGSRGSAGERLEESSRAAGILGVARRCNAELPDGQLSNTHDMQVRLIPYLRAFRPRILLAPMSGDRHPDHGAAHALVQDANYFAGLSRIETNQAPHRAPRVYYYRVYKDTSAPAFVVDVSEDFNTKIEALRAHSSQFFNETYEGAPTYVSSEAFWKLIRDRAAYWGARIGVDYGEPLFAEDPPGVDLPPGFEEIACE